MSSMDLGLSALSALASGAFSDGVDPETFLDGLEAAPAPFVKMMLRQMKNLLQSPRSIEQHSGANNMMVLTARDQICTYALELDVIKPLVRLAHTAVEPTPGLEQEPPIAAVAIAALSNFTNFDHTNAVMSAGAVPHVARFLPRTTGLADVYSYRCLRVLADTLRDSETAAQQAEAAAVMNHLKPHLTSPHDASKQCAAACVYHLLRQRPAAIPATVSSGYVPPLASLLHHEDPETIFNAEGSMLCLARVVLPAAQHAISSSGAITTLSQRCLALSDIHVRHMATAALTCVAAAGPQQRQEIIDAGGLPLLISCLQEAQKPELQQTAAECLHSIAAGGCVYGHQILAAGVLEPLMAMLGSTTDEGVLRAGSRLAACMCGCQHNRPEMLPVVLQQATAVDSSRTSSSSSSGKAGDESNTGAALVLAAMVIELCAHVAQVVVDGGGVSAMVAVRARTQVPYAQQRLDQALAELEGMGGGCAAAVSSAREEVRVLQQQQQAQRQGAGAKAMGKGSSSSSSSRHAADGASRGGSSGRAAAGAAAGAARLADQAVRAPAAGAGAGAAAAAVSAADVCAKCGSSGRDTIKLHRCAGCKAVRYCSKECQKGHWKMHKPRCTAKPGS